MAKVRITQVRSKNGATQRQKDNLRSLGLRRINHSVAFELTPIRAGQIQKIRHLVKTEEI